MFPEGLKQIYKDIEPYYFENDCGMDNVEAMNFFLNNSNIPDIQILENDGTKVTLYLTGEKDVVILHCSGRGDEFNHVIEVERMPYLDWMNESLNVG